MSDVKIKKARIKDDLFLEVEFSESLPGHSKKETKLSCTVPVHEDLKVAFSKLDKHLALLCDEVKLKGKKIEGIDAEELAAFTVRGFSIGGNDENEGVSINGSKEGKYGIVNLNTPFTKWESDEYPFVADLGADVQLCIHEVNEYLFNEKRAPERQLAMDFGDSDDEINTAE